MNFAVPSNSEFTAIGKLNPLDAGRATPVQPDQAIWKGAG
jgi:hypothetical protein